MIWDCLNPQPLFSPSYVPGVSGPGRRPELPIHVFLIVLFCFLIKENKLINENIVSGSHFLSKHGVAVIFKKRFLGVRG